jgi:hypothetical protein
MKVKNTMIAALIMIATVTASTGVIPVASWQSASPVVPALSVALNTQEVGIDSNLRITFTNSPPACGMPEIRWKIYDSNNNVKTSEAYYFNSYDGWGSLNVIFSVQPRQAGLTAGNYYILADWFCYGEKVSGTLFTEHVPFVVTSGTTSPTEPPVVVCNAGEKLQNGKCVPAYVIGDGYCQAYEPLSSPDCELDPCDNYNVGNGDCEVCEPLASPDCSQSGSDTTNCPSGYYIKNGDCVKGYEQSFFAKYWWVLLIGAALIVGGLLIKR